MPDSSPPDSPDEETTPSEETPSENSTADPNGETEGNDDAEDLSPFLEAIKAPISEDAPAGESVTYDDDFQTVKTQINNIGSASGQADYENISELARTVLTDKSKDLRAAGYLVIGEARANGAASLAEALRGVQLLIETYWEDLYPAKDRMRGRGSALQFISDRLSDWISSTEFEQEDRAPLVTARDALKDIQDFGLQEMGEHAPAFSGLLNELDGVIDSLPEPEPEEPSAEDSETPPADTDAEQAPSSSASPSAPSAPSELASESDATTAVTKAAAFLRDQDLTNPIPYRLLRAVQWGVLNEAPPNEGGETRLQPPREQRRTYLSGLLDDGEYETLVQEGESSFQGDTFHLWLDLQRLVASALDALGAPYEAAHTAVMLDVARLIRRLPALTSLSYSDGTPFASPLTVDWIETQVQPMLEADGDGSTSTAVDGQMPVTEQYEEARQRLSGGDLDEALGLMKEGAAEDLSEKESFYRRLYIATLCMKGGQPSVAAPLLDELDAGIERHALDAWNPSLALEVWANRCRCYDALAQEAPTEEKEALFAEADDAFEKICRVDATRAVELDGQRPS